jgi:organic radical activating enzyme
VYAVQEIFRSLQGEGANAGRPAVFLRLAGCNLWSGRDADRERDASRAGADCPRWCDTDFVSARRGRAVDEVAREVAHLGATCPGPEGLLVITGGEPLLQLDRRLTDAIRAACDGQRLTIAVETNGTVQFRDGSAEAAGVDWVCVSPKTAPERVAVRSGNELKVVYPSGLPAPHEYAAALGGFARLYVSPPRLPDVRRLAVRGALGVGRGGQLRLWAPGLAAVGPDAQGARSSVTRGGLRHGSR